MTKLKTTKTSKRQLRLEAKFVGKLCKVAHPPGTGISPNNVHYFYRVEPTKRTSTWDNENQRVVHIFQGLIGRWQTTAAIPFSISEETRVLVIDVVRDTHKSAAKDLSWYAICLLEQGVYSISMAAISLGNVTT